MAIPSTDERRFTYADYCGWDEGRFELIDGEVFDMSPAPTVDHQSVVVELVTQIHTFLRRAKGDCRVFVAPFDVRLPRAQEADDEVDTVVQPDVLVVCDRSKLDRRGCRGAPDWIIEITSPSTASKDQMLKRQLYERHGVREYWLVHPVDRTLTVYRPDSEGRYGAPVVTDAEGASTIELFPDLEVDWSLVFADSDDE